MLLWVYRFYFVFFYHSIGVTIDYCLFNYNACIQCIDVNLYIKSYSCFVLLQQCNKILLIKTAVFVFITLVVLLSSIPQLIAYFILYHIFIFLAFVFFPVGVGPALPVVVRGCAVLRLHSVCSVCVLAAKHCNYLLTLRHFNYCTTGSPSIQ